MAVTRVGDAEIRSARDLVRSAISVSVSRLDAELPRAREGVDPEGVHQARVATRRLRSDLRTFAPLLDEAWRVQMRADLRRLTDALGAVRDADVLAIRLDETIRSAGVAPSRGLDDRIAGERAEAHAALVAVIDDPWTDQLLDRLREAATNPPTTSEADGRARRRVRPLAARPWKRVRRSVRALPADPPIEQLHQVRLLTKRARYAAEAVTPVFGRDAKRFASALARLQDVLGEMNDAAQLAEWLTAAVPHLESQDAFTAGRLVAGLRLEIDEHRHDWQRRFARAERRSEWLTD